MIALAITSTWYLVLAAVLFGIAVLGEGAALTPTASVMMVIACAIAVTGVVLLSRFHPTSAPVG